MEIRMLHALNPVIRRINKYLFPRFNIESCPHDPLLILKCGIVQKIFGINRHVPWPVHWTSQVKSPNNIAPGTRTPGLGLSCYIDGRNGIVIEENVWIGPRVSIISMNHDLHDYTQYVSGKSIVIKKDSILLANSIILPEIELGEHTVVAAGAVVTKSFPEGHQVLAGNPARIIRKLGEDS